MIGKRASASPVVTTAADARPFIPGRVLILYSDIGEGHVATARALAAELAEESPETTVVLENALAHMGRFLRFLQRDLYHTQLLRRPWLYGLWYSIFAASRLLRALGALTLCLLSSRSLRRLVISQSPDLVVSTDPRATVALGHLRLLKKLTMPVYALISDLGGVEFWVHPGIDVHLVTHSGLVPAVERLVGRGGVRLVRPPVQPVFFSPLERADARRALELPEDRAVFLLSGGGWGAGDFDGALLAALDVPEALVLCLCGRNAVLKTRLEDLAASREDAVGRVRVLGFTNRMSELLAAGDVLVHSTGGVTYLEASVRRCPVVIYGAQHGHMRKAAKAMVGLNEAVQARSRGELSRLLAQIAVTGASAGQDPRSHPRVTATLLAAQPRAHKWRGVVPWLTLSGGTPGRPRDRRHPVEQPVPALEEA